MKIFTIVENLLINLQFYEKNENASEYPSCLKKIYYVIRGRLDVSNSVSSKP